MHRPVKNITSIQNSYFNSNFLKRNKHVQIEWIISYESTINLKNFSLSSLISQSQTNSHYRNLCNHIPLSRCTQNSYDFTSWSRILPTLVIPLPLPARRNRNLSHVSGWNLLSPRVGGRRGILRAVFSPLFSFFLSHRAEERERKREINAQGCVDVPSAGRA